MDKFIYIGLMIVSGLVCYLMARKRQLSQPWLWFLLGVAIHVFAIAIVSKMAKHVSSQKKGVTS